MVVVVSAMAGETNRLIALARELQAQPDPRELDVMVSTGEQVTIALLAMALMDLGLKARSYTGGQVRILTDSAHTKARIVSIDEQRLRSDLAEGTVVVVAGFQGVDPLGNITTLGRGGSDTTGVALAAALKADECQIYTDVDGVYTADPRIVPEARRLEDRDLRGDAGDGEPRLEGPADPLGGVRRALPREAARTVELRGRGRGHPDHFRGRAEHGASEHFRHRVQPRRGEDHDPRGSGPPRHRLPDPRPGGRRRTSTWT